MIEELLNAYENAIQAGEVDECAHQFLVWSIHVELALQAAGMREESELWADAQKHIRFSVEDSSFPAQAEAMKAILMGLRDRLPLNEQENPNSNHLHPDTVPRDDERGTLVNEIDALKSMMIAVATGGPRIQERNQEYIQRRRAVGALLLKYNLQDPNPYSDLWAWYGRWSGGDLPTYQSRRQYIAGMYQPVIDHLLKERERRITEPIQEPTGWARVDRNIDAIRIRLESAQNEEEYQTVGLLCRETLISLAQSVYNPETHVPSDGVTPSETDAYRMLDGYFGSELPGTSNEAARKHAKAALALANELQHRRTASLKDAALCAEATRTVVNIVAIVSDRK
jgi:hypothetical protein